MDRQRELRQALVTLYNILLGCEYAASASRNCLDVTEEESYLPTITIRDNRRDSSSISLRPMSSDKHLWKREEGGLISRIIELRGD